MQDNGQNNIPNNSKKLCRVCPIRYVESFEEKTAYYGLIDLEGDGTSSNIVKCLNCLWKKDDINPRKSCWLATDNASTFTGEYFIILSSNL